MTGFDIIGVGLGLLAVLISAFALFYQRRQALPKRLTIYSYGSRQLLSIDRSIAARFRTIFDGKEINSLFGIRYLIENTGNKAIAARDCLEPLSVTTKRPSLSVQYDQDQVKPKLGLLDASVVYSQPESTKVRVKTELLTEELKRTTFEFPLLNEGDLFIIQLLFDIRVNPEDLKFNIRVEDLRESTFTPTGEPFLLNMICKPGGLTAGIILWALAFLAILVSAYFTFLSPSNLLGQRGWSAYVLTAIPFGLLLVALVGMLIHLFRISGKKRRRSPVPDEFRWK